MSWLLSTSLWDCGGAERSRAASRGDQSGISTMVVSGQRTFADALAVRLRAEPDMTVIAVAQSADAARRVLIGRQVDVLLLDRELPGDAALQLCAEASAAESGPRILILSEDAEPSRIVAAVRAGATGWAGKAESVDHLLQVIRRVANGETWLPPAQLGGVLRLLMHGDDEPSGEANLLATLTPREQEVLSLLIRGAGRKEVAEQLHLSANTVRTHLRSLMTKLGAHSTLELVAKTRSTFNFPAGSGDDSAPPH